MSTAERPLVASPGPAERTSARESITTAIGHTPVIPLHFPEASRTITAKCEFLNPSGSIKDRLARTVIDDAERRNLLRSDSVILECSSGNTGVAFSMLGAARGYKVKIVLAESASHERRQLIEQLGGEVITFPGHDYSVGVELVRRLAAQDSRYFLPRQFENPLNALDHELHTATELLTQVPGRIEAFVAGYGTGGTLAGMSRALRRVHPGIRICAMEPAEAALMRGEQSCAHAIEGIADGFIPALLNDVKIDEVLTVSSAEAVNMTKELTRRFGL
ncbi:MAG TPA: cysteine synthase family protein, partial [Lacunisphaera sp.]|nr:cysteine synthase family protein [Lacunisphaera sp.]